MADVVTDSMALFNPTNTLSKNYNDGILSVPAMGFNFAMSQNVPTHTCGGYDGAYVLNGNYTAGATTMTVQTGTGTMKAGDIYTAAACYSVNPLTKASTGKLYNFVVGTDYAGGAGDITIANPVWATGPYQNVDALPLTGAATTELGTASTVYPQNLAFHKGFGAIGFCDLDIPKGVPAGAAKRVVEDGISLRLIDFYDGVNDDSYLRFDVLFGYKTVIPRWACRIYGV
jgi:hypothetical protein